MHMTLVDPARADADSNEARVVAAVERLLAAHPPSSTPEREFLEAQYDAGLAWVHFPQGNGGLGVSPKLQKIVIDAVAAGGFGLVDHVTRVPFWRVELPRGAALEAYAADLRDQHDCFMSTSAPVPRGTRVQCRGRGRGCGRTRP